VTRGTPGILRALEERGLLLLQDKTLPNLVSLVTGEPIRGSWWAHPKSHEIFRLLTDLEHHPDVLICKLVAGKVTLVHRRLWPAILAVATSREAWQTAGLSAQARTLLEQLEKEESVVASGEPVKELERRLLASTREEHGEKGAHQVVARRWDLWARETGIASEISCADGKKLLEEAASSIGATASMLPWGPARSGRR
jgi:hypothetical protein